MPNAVYDNITSNLLNFRVGVLDVNEPKTLKQIDHVAVSLDRYYFVVMYAEVVEGAVRKDVAAFKTGISGCRTYLHVSYAL